MTFFINNQTVQIEEFDQNPVLRSFWYCFMKLGIKIKEKGFTVIPTLLFINENGLAKLEIGVAKGKKLYDKRESIKTKDNKRDLDRSSDY